MNPADLLLVVLVLGGLASWSVVIWRLGILRGRDIQRVEDIQDLWKHMPDRDGRGRFCRRSTT